MRRRAGVRSTQRRNLTMTIVNDPNNRFAGVPVEDDTRILSRAETEIAGIPVLVESSRWDGTYMESLIFVDADVEDKDDEALEAMVRATGRVEDDSSMTIRRTIAGYTFVNFNFDFND